MNTPRTISPTYQPTFTWGFRRFVFTVTGRTLTQHALSLIERLERQRLRIGYIRATIDSTDYPYDEIAEPLQLYIRYVRDHLHIRGRYPETAIVNATKRLADRFGRGINPTRRYSTTDTFVMGTRFCYALRGHTPDILLMFDVDRFPRDTFSVIFRTGVSAIELYRGTVIIVHGNFIPKRPAILTAATRRHYRAVCRTATWLVARPEYWTHITDPPPILLDGSESLNWQKPQPFERSELAGVQAHTHAAARRVAISQRPKTKVPRPRSKVRRPKSSQAFLP